MIKLTDEDHQVIDSLAEQFYHPIRSYLAGKPVQTGRELITLAYVTGKRAGFVEAITVPEFAEPDPQYNVTEEWE